MNSVTELFNRAGRGEIFLFRNGDTILMVESGLKKEVADKLRALAQQISSQCRFVRRRLPAVQHRYLIGCSVVIIWTNMQTKFQAFIRGTHRRYDRYGVESDRIFSALFSLPR